MKKNDSLKSIIVLVGICIVIGAAMAGINMITADRIAAVQAEKEAKALETVLPENEGFEKLEDIPELPESVVAVYRDKDGEGIAMLLCFLRSSHHMIFGPNAIRANREQAN